MKKLILAVSLALFLFGCNNTKASASSRPVEIVAHGFDTSPEFSSDRSTNESVAAHIEGNIESFLKVGNVRYTHITATVEPSGVEPQHGVWRRYRLTGIRVDGQLVTEDILGVDVSEVGKKAAKSIEKFRTTSTPVPTSSGLDSLVKNLPRGEWDSVEGSDIFVKDHEGHVWVIDFYSPTLRHVPRHDPEGNGSLTPVFQAQQLRDGCEVWNTPPNCYFNQQEWTWAQAKGFMSKAVNSWQYGKFVEVMPPYLAKQFHPVNVE